MGKLDKEMRETSGNSVSPETDETREDIVFGKKDYSTDAVVYVITSGKAGHGSLPKLELGKTERRVINTATRLANLFRLAEIALPLQCVVTPDEQRMYYGKGFKLSQDIDDTAFAQDLMNIVEEGVIRFVSVTVVQNFPFAYVLYGRGDKPEYFANVYLGSEQGDDAI